MPLLGVDQTGRIIKDDYIMHNADKKKLNRQKRECKVVKSMPWPNDIIWRYWSGWNLGWRDKSLPEPI